MRRSTVVVALVALIGVSVTSWILGSQIRSSAEVAAGTAPPGASLISVPVEKRTLSSEVVVRGTVRYGSPQAVSLPASALKTGNGVVTTAPVAGAAVAEGGAALAVSGRPVIVLQGAEPAYRDLGLGAEGTDVGQLEAALQRLGFDPGAVDGVYDSATANGVAAFYRSSGWTPYVPTAEQVASLRSAQGDRFTVRSDALSADESLDSARAAKALADADVVNKRVAARVAADVLPIAQLQLAEARTSDPVASASEIASLDAAVRAATGTIEAAHADLVAATATASSAGNAVGVAERRVSLLGSRDVELGAVVGDLSAALGVQVPANEIVFFPTMPVRIGDVTVKLGEEPVGAVMTVSGSQLAVEGALDLTDAKIVRAGAPVSLEAADLGVKAAGVVRVVADAPGTNGVDPQRYFVEVTPADAPASLVGASVVVKITVGATEGKVLAVPVAGVSVAGDGSSRVEVEQRGGGTRTVAVTPGLAANGLVAVEPVRDGLSPGDRVIVGKGATPRSGPSTSPGASTKQGARAH